MAVKREMKNETVQKGFSVADLILVAILLAAGAVLKYFVGSLLNVAGMKPNFIIAMYCLAILLIRPKVPQAAVIGLISGVICQFAPGTPFINIGSELVGAVVMVLLMKLPLQLGKINLRPVVCTFLATISSGFAFIGLQYLMLAAGLDVTATPVLAFLPVIFGTALINSIIVQALYLPLRYTVKKD